MSTGHRALQSSAAEIDPAAIGLLLKLGACLHKFGAPAFRIENELEEVAERLGIDGRFFSTPTSLMVAFGPPEEQRTSFVRVVPAETNLEKLAGLYKVIEEYLESDMPAVEARRRIEEIDDAPQRYGPVATTAALALASGGACTLFGGGIPEAALAAGVGVMLGVMGAFFFPRPHLARVYELLGALLASALVGIVGRSQGISVPEATLAGLIILVPGFTLTLAMNEIATRHLVSGTSRLAGAVVIFLLLAFGVALGQELARLAVPVANIATPTPLPSWSLHFIVAASLPGFAVLFRAAPRHWGWVIAGGLIAWFGSRLGATLISPELGAGVGAFLLGSASNLYARVLKRPASVPLTPGILLLVPGSLGFRSMSSLLEQETLAGVDNAFTMLLVAISIVAGLLMANAIVQPRTAL